ncbi:MAG: amino acid ABC transporter substrate-binding protein [Pseudomonadota bacterium]
MCRRLIVTFLCLLFTAFSANFAGAAEPLKIGISLGLTGKYAQMSDMSLKAYKLWEQNINARGGLLGRTVQLNIQDDKSDAATAREIYRHWIEDEKIDLVIGPYSSEITAAVLPVTEEHRYPLLAAGAAADVLWQRGYKYVFGIYVPTSKYMVSFLELLATEGLNKIAMVGADDLFSKEIALGAKEWVKRFGLTIVFSEEFKNGTKPLTTVIQRAQGSGADVLVVFGYLDESVNARLALKEIGWSPRAYYATVGPAVQRYHDILKDDAENAFSSSQWEPTSSFPGAKEFTEQFFNAYHMLPSYHAGSAYAAGQVMETAIRKSRSIDREKIRSALSSLDTMTIMGRYGVDRTGRQVRHFGSTVQWQKGRKEIVSPKELMTAKPVWK